MEHADWFFGIINGLDVELPKSNLSPGPSAPDPLVKFFEGVTLDSYLSKPLHDEQQAEFNLQKLLGEAEYFRDRAITPGPPQSEPFGSALHKRATEVDVPDDRKIVTHYSAGDVIAILDEHGAVTKTYFQPRAA